MDFKFSLINKLADATPRKNILKWLAITLFYATVIIVNDHFDVVQALGFSERLTAVIRLSGVYIYIMLTTHSFYKTKTNEDNNNNNQITSDMESNDKPDRISAASGTQIHAQGNRENES